MYAAQTGIWLLNGSNNFENIESYISQNATLCFLPAFIRLHLPGKLHAHSVFMAVWLKFEVSWWDNPDDIISCFPLLFKEDIVQLLSQAE